MSAGQTVAWVLNLLTDLAFNLLIFFVVMRVRAETDDEAAGRRRCRAPSKDKTDRAEGAKHRSGA